MQSQELTTQDMFNQILDMIDENPELFDTLSDLCERALQVIENKQ
jgi:hypothetical protein